MIFALAIPGVNAQNTVKKTKGFSYQAVARDADGSLIQNTNVSVRASIVQGSATGQVVYTESHQSSTGQFGMINLKIGQGVPQAGSFENIDWSAENQWLKIEMDVNGGNNYVEFGTTQILSVPYALHAAQAETLVGGLPEIVGTEWHDGFGDPLADTGKDGDYYVDVSTGKIYKKIDGEWDYRGTIVGNNPSGETRADPNDWTMTGNAGTNASTNFVGTTDAVDFVLRTNSTEMMRLNNGSHIDMFGGTKNGPQTDLMIGENGDLPQIELSDEGKSGAIRYHKSAGMSMWTNGGGSGGGWVQNLSLRPTGRVGIGVNNPAYMLQVNGRIKTNGINELSDKRMKKDIKPLQNSLDKILSMKGVSYNWRIDEFTNLKLDEDLQIGLIAQDVEEILPEVVDTDEEGYKSVEYSHIVPVLIEAIKEQQQIINHQQNLISEITVELTNIKQQINTPEELKGVDHQTTTKK